MWLTILLDLPEPYSCFLALGDNTSAVSWLHKASVDELENKPLHMATRKYAETLMNQNCCLYSQHIQGAKNSVADALSRMHNYSPLHLHSYIIENFHSQVPTTFHIVQLPQEISSWLISWLQKVKELKELEKEQQTKKREHSLIKCTFILHILHRLVQMQFGNFYTIPHNFQNKGNYTPSILCIISFILLTNLH